MTFQSSRPSVRVGARLAGALVAVSLLGSLAACGASGSKSSAKEETRTVKVLLDWTPNTNYAGIYLAKERGWYRDVGLDVQIIEPGGDSDVLGMVAKGSVDFGISNAEQLVPAREQGLPVVSVAAIIEHNTSSLIALQSSGIHDLADLAGRTYGSFGGTFEKALIDTLIRCGGGDPSGVTFREVGDSDFRQGLTRKVYDFVWVFDAWDTIRLGEIDKLPLTHLAFADHTDCIPDWYTPILTTSQGRIDKDPALVETFLSATARGYRAAMAEPQAAADALLAGAPELDRDLVERSARYLSTRYVDDPAEWGRQDPAVWQRFVRFLAGEGLVGNGFDVPAAYTNRFLPAPAAVEGSTPSS